LLFGVDAGRGTHGAAQSIEVDPGVATVQEGVEIARGRTGHPHNLPGGVDAGRETVTATQGAKIDDRILDRQHARRDGAGHQERDEHDRLDQYQMRWGCQTWPQHPFRWCGVKTAGCGKHQLNE
jgi:hypothetical protein